MCIASLKGAVVLCRSTRSAYPLRDVARQVEFLIKSREFVRRSGLPSVDRLRLSGRQPPGTKITDTVFSPEFATYTLIPS